VKGSRRHCGPPQFRGSRGGGSGKSRIADVMGWTSPRIAEAFGVREDTVRLWRSDFARGGVEALKTSPAPEPAPVGLVGPLFYRREKRE
jgi:Helix-turn-helix domain